MLKKCIRTNIASCWKVLVPGTHRVSILDIGENKSLEQIFAYPSTGTDPIPEMHIPGIVEPVKGKEVKQQKDWKC